MGLQEKRREDRLQDDSDPPCNGSMFATSLNPATEKDSAVKKGREGENGEFDDKNGGAVKKSSSKRDTVS